MSKNREKKVYPYARIKGMNEIMQFIIQPSWCPVEINSDIIKKLNIAPSKETLVVATLKILEIIDDHCNPTEQFDRLKENYQETLKQIIREKYKDVFALLPDKMISQVRIVNYFMKISRKDTAEYQGILFAWLCEKAGIDLPNLSTSFKRARLQNRK